MKIFKIGILFIAFFVISNLHAAGYNPFVIKVDMKKDGLTAIAVKQGVSKTINVKIGFKQVTVNGTLPYEWIYEVIDKDNQPTVVTDSGSTPATPYIEKTFDSKVLSSGRYRIRARAKYPNKPDRTWVMCADGNNLDVVEIKMRCEIPYVAPIRECMEGRTVTFSATATGSSTSETKSFTFKYVKPDGTTGTAFEVTDGNTTSKDIVMPIVPETDQDHKFPVAMQCELLYRGERLACDDLAVPTSQTIDIDVFKLWIEICQEPGKFGKVVVGNNISYKALASRDCTNWKWSVTTNAWLKDENGGKSKEGSDLKIPYTNLPTKSNSQFGNNTFKVECKDGESRSIDSSTIAKIFFDPDRDVTGDPVTGSSANTKVACWYKFWKDGNVCSGLNNVGYENSTRRYGVYTGTPGQSGGTIKVSHPAAVGSNTIEQYMNLDQITQGVMGTTNKHLQCLAETIQHEMYHKHTYEVLYGMPGAVHTDQDKLPDNEENTPSETYFPKSDPTITNSLNSSYDDQEVRCRIKESHLTVTTDPSKDWSADVENPQWMN